MMFKTILIDPPWEFDDKLDDTRKKPYNTLSFEKLKELPIQELSMNDCHLYLWVPNSFLKEALELVEYWNFKYKLPIIWLKRTKNGKKWFGMGHYFRNCTEICLFAIKGNLKLKTKNTRNFIDAKKPENHHASKPDEIYDLIENNSYFPYLELFATQKRLNWYSFGYEIDNKDIFESMKEVLK